MWALIAAQLLAADAPVPDYAAWSKRIGERVDGTVKKVTPNGAFVDLGGGALGLVHVTDLDWSGAKSAEARVKIGQKLNVKIDSVDVEKKRIGLVAKRDEDDPWKKQPSKYKVGQKVSGKVTSTMDLGVFIELSPYFEAMIHKSDLPVGKAPADYKEGDVLAVTITDVDAEKQRISATTR